MRVASWVILVLSLVVCVWFLVCWRWVIHHVDHITIHPSTYSLVSSFKYFSGSWFLVAKPTFTHYDVAFFGVIVLLIPCVFLVSYLPVLVVPAFAKVKSYSKSFSHFSFLVGHQPREYGTRTCCLHTGSWARQWQHLRCSHRTCHASSQGQARLRGQSLW